MSGFSSSIVRQHTIPDRRAARAKVWRIPHLYVKSCRNITQSQAESLTDTDFSNIVKKSALERLAEADDHEVVKGVMEYFADFLVINPDLCSIRLPARLFSTSPELWNQDSLARSTEGIIALLLSLKKKPLIRYEKNSLLCKKLATEVRYSMTQEEQLFDFRKTDTPPILLILDRREDPITPLLTQWTYQAMVHELLGINNGRVNLSDVPDIRPEFKVHFSSLDANGRVLTVLRIL
jgi:vacuolar protein sorting-associated protein 45